MHNRPTISQTILLQNMYQNPVINAPLGPDGFPIKVDERKAQKEFEVSAQVFVGTAARFAGSRAPAAPVDLTLRSSQHPAPARS